MKVEESLLMAGVAEEADLYVLGLRGEAVLMSAEEAAATGRIPRGKGAMRAWNGVLEQYKLLERAVPERGVRGMRVLGEVEKRLARVRAEDDRQALPLEQVTADEEGLLKFLEKVEEGKKGVLGTKLAPMQAVAAGRATEGMPRREGRRFKEECKNLLRGAFQAAKRMPAVEWEHGNPADEARFKGPHVIGVLPHREEFCVGTPARLVGMQERQAGPSLWNVDEEGYVRYKEWRLTDSIDLAQLTAEWEVEVPCTVRAFLLAREALELAETPVLLEPPVKRSLGNFIVAAETRRLFEVLLDLEMRTGAHALWSLDGSRRFDTELEKHVSSRVALRHDGQAVGGKMEAADSYTTELAAQLDAARAEGARRIMLVFDASSPVEAWMRWRGRHDWQKMGYYHDEVLDALDKQLGKFEVVVFVWANAHHGITLNEWADAEAAVRLAEEELTPVVTGVSRHRSLYLGERRSAAAQAEEAMSLWVQGRLRESTHETQWRAAADLSLGRRSAADEDDLHALLGSRWFIGDKTYAPGELGDRVRGALCPCCGAREACTFIHALTKCTGLQDQRRSMLEAARGVARCLSDKKDKAAPHGQAEAVEDALYAAVYGVMLRSRPVGEGKERRTLSAEQLAQHVTPKQDSPLAKRILRALGMLWEGAHMEDRKAAKAALEEMATTVLAWMREAEKKCAPQTRAIAERLRAQRGVEGVWRLWRRRTRAAGPARLGRLREVRAAMRIVGEIAAGTGRLGGRGERSLGARLSRFWRSRRLEVELQFQSPWRARLEAAELEAGAEGGTGTEEGRSRWQGVVGLATRFRWAAVRYGRQSKVREEALARVVWAECVEACRGIMDEAEREEVKDLLPVEAGVRWEEDRFKEVADKCRRWAARRCGVGRWEGPVEAHGEVRESFFQWAVGQGTFQARRLSVRKEGGGEVEGSGEGRWVAGRWVVAEPEFQEPRCAGCCRCRAQYMVEAAVSVGVGGEGGLFGKKRIGASKRREVRKEEEKRRRLEEEERKAEVAGMRRRLVVLGHVRGEEVGGECEENSEEEVVEEVGAREGREEGGGAELVWVMKERRRWARHEGFQRWRKGVRQRRSTPASELQSAIYRQVDKLGYRAQDLERWRARKRRSAWERGRRFVGGRSRKEVTAEEEAARARRLMASAEARAEERKAREARAEVTRRRMEEMQEEELQRSLEQTRKRLAGEGGGVWGGLLEEEERRGRQEVEARREEDKRRAVARVQGGTSGGRVLVRGQWVRVGWEGRRAASGGKRPEEVSTHSRDRSRSRARRQLDEALECVRES